MLLLQIPTIRKPQVTPTSFVQTFFDKELGLVCLVMFILSTLLFILLSTQIKGFLKDKWRLFLYVFTFILIFSISPVIGYSNFIPYALDFFIVLQVMFLFWGVIHTVSIYRYFDWTRRKNIFPELGFTLFIILIGSIPLLLSLKYLREDGLHFAMLGVLLCFLIPFFVFQTFEYAISIPLANRKAWYFFNDEKWVAPKFTESSETLFLNIEANKKENDKTMGSFVARTDERMPFGLLYYHFLNDYNEKNPSDKIHYMNKKNKIYGWVFYVRPRWFNFIRYIDPEKTIKENKLRNKDTIVALRYDIK